MKNLTLLISMLITVISLGQNQKPLNEKPDALLNLYNIDTYLYAENTESKNWLGNNKQSGFNCKYAAVKVSTNINSIGVIVEETETPLDLESWMIDENYFKTSPNILEESDNPLEFEEWIYSEQYLGRPINF
jgi:hypothetical protein